MDRPLKSTPGCPHTGWRWIDAVDLHDDEGLEYGDYETCEFCWREQIRFVHTLRHPDWPNDIQVGKICAEVLSGDANAALKEAQLRKRAQRRANFPKLKGWKTSANGNLWIEYMDHHVVVIRHGGGKCSLCIDKKFGKMMFESERAAMLKAFDVVMRKVEQGR